MPLGGVQIISGGSAHPPPSPHTPQKIRACYKVDFFTGDAGSMEGALSNKTVTLLQNVTSYLTFHYSFNAKLWSIARPRRN
jgi:hypothetical protein